MFSFLISIVKSTFRAQNYAQFTLFFLPFQVRGEQANHLRKECYDLHWEVNWLVYL